MFVSDAIRTVLGTAVQTGESSGGNISVVLKGIDIFTGVIMLVFTLCYFYQYVFIPIAWFGKRSIPKAENKNRFAILVCGRNEERVIRNCIDSLLSQNYPDGLIKVFVCADNCTDGTAAIARERP